MKILLVGLGGMGSCHYANAQQIPIAEVTAAVGQSDKDRSVAAEWGIPIYATITEACTSETVELVDICAPTFLHKELVLEAIANGKHVIVEKPVALHYDDVVQMYEAAHKAGVQLYVAQVVQFKRETEALRQVLADGRYGRPLDGYFQRLTACPKWTHGRWLFDRDKSGLIPYDLHIHDLDLIISLFGKPDRVAYTSCRCEGKDYDEHYRFSYGYSSGLNVVAEAGWLNAAIPFMAHWRVYFERGMLICDENGVTGYDADGEKTVFDVSETVRVASGINLPASGEFLRELTHLIECAQRGEPSPMVPKQRILDVMEILEQIRY
ncbi:MAG: Gfo/Idh/MocA family oxidoreductase [Clostridia bacterium]|nr:Gfo/Idh/MocA family oxidoreductase [Clostridia bacterium]